MDDIFPSAGAGTYGPCKPLRLHQELIEGCLTACSVEDIHALCSRLCLEFGFDYFIYGAQFPTSLIQPQIAIISGFPAEWRTHYTANKYLTIDPTIAHCASRVTPLVWNTITKAEVEKRAKRFMSEAYDFGLHSGVSFPLHCGGGESAMLSLASKQDHERIHDRITAVLPCAQLTIGYIHEASRRVLQEHNVLVDRAQLTDREKECLLWTAEGKTAWELSKILRISERTAVFHLQNAARKLNVSNRSQAVARAISQKLITPQI